MTDFSAPTADIHAAARTSVTQTVANLAILKNVRVAPEFHAALASVAIEAMSLDEICQLVARERSGVAAATRAVNQQLDTLAIGLIAFLIGKGEVRAADDPVVIQMTTRIVPEFDAKFADKQCVRWPDPVDMVLGYYARTPHGPVVTTPPDGGVCTTYWLNGILTAIRRKVRRVISRTALANGGIQGQCEPAASMPKAPLIPTPTLRVVKFPGRNISKMAYRTVLPAKDLPSRKPIAPGDASSKSMPNEDRCIATLSKARPGIPWKRMVSVGSIEFAAFGTATSRMVLP